MDAQGQLAALADIGALLDEAGLDYWLFGGWAVDFHLGAVTREHDDIDVAVWLRDVEGDRETAGNPRVATQSVSR